MSVYDKQPGGESHMQLMCRIHREKGARQERERIVRRLQERAATHEHYGRFDLGAVLLMEADAIERGEHRGEQHD